MINTSKGSKEIHDATWQPRPPRRLADDSDDQPTEATTPVPIPDLPGVAARRTTFFSRLFRLRRSGGCNSSNRNRNNRHLSGTTVFDEEEQMQKRINDVDADDSYLHEEKLKDPTYVDNIYLRDDNIDNDKVDKRPTHASLTVSGRSNAPTANQQQRSPRASIPGAFRVSPSGPPQTSLHRYDSGANNITAHPQQDLFRPQEDILVEASIVPPSRPEPPQEPQLPAVLEPKHLVVEASPMAQPSKDAIVLNKRRVLILTAIAAFLIIALATGLGMSLMKSSDRPNRTSSSNNFNATLPPKEGLNRGGGNKGGSTGGGSNGGGSNGGQAVDCSTIRGRCDGKLR